MELHDVPPGSKIRVIDAMGIPPAHREFETNEILTFHHIDGMYSFCTDKNKKPVHLKAWAEVEIIGE